MTSSHLAHRLAAYTTRESAPSTVRVHRVPLSSQQRGWIEKAWSFLDVQKAINIDVDLVNIYSPSGYEKEVNTFVVDYWKRFGVDAWYQEMDPHQGNAIARFRGSGDGPTVLLCCPIDTHWTGKPEEDGLQYGEPMRRDNMRPAQVEGQTIIGLGSNNDKGMATAIMMAVEALARAEVPFKGTLLAATLAGGAPALSPPHEPRKNITLCAGLYHALVNGITGDYCVFHKPGYNVSWEEPGMCYFRVRVMGDPQYMGTFNRKDRPYRVLVDTARIVEALDKWSDVYRVKAKGGTFQPAMAVGSVRAGMPHKPNWSPAISEVFLDIRPAPWTAPIEVKYWFDEVMRQIVKENPGMQAEWEMYVAMPGGRTDPESWIVQSAIRGAQFVQGDTGETYEGVGPGQTEAGVLRTWGIPTARISGSPPNPELPADLRGHTMSGAYAPYIVKAAQVIIYTLVDTLTRSREEVGLAY